MLLSSNAALRTSAQVMSVIEKPELTKKTMRVEEKVRTEKCRVDIASDGIQTSVAKYCCRLRPYWEIQLMVAVKAVRRSCKVNPASLLFPLAERSLKSDPSTFFASRSCSFPCQTILAVQYSNGHVKKLRPISRRAPSRGELVADMKAEIAIGEPSLHMRSIRLMTALSRDRSYGGWSLSAAPAATIVGTQSRSMETRLASRDNRSKIPSARIRRKRASFHWCSFNGRASVGSVVGSVDAGTSSCTSLVMMMAQQTQAAMTKTRLTEIVVKRVRSRDGA